MELKKNYVISSSRLKQLLEAEAELNALKAAGVDNWDGIEYAEYKDWDPKEFENYKETDEPAFALWDVDKHDDENVTMKRRR